MITRLNHVIAFVICFPSVGFAQMQISTDFAGGSAQVVAIDTATQSAHIRPALQKDRGWPCWWYFRLDGLRVGEKVEITVGANSTPFRERRILDRSWLLPDRAALSDDNITWRQTGEANRVGKVAVYGFDASAESMWIAWGPPYLPSHANQLLKDIGEMLPSAEVFELARTRHQRPVNAIRFGAASHPSAQPYAIWVQARQHAWEAGSSWVAQGFLQWAASDDPSAVELRGKATIHFVPIMDVDNVSDGAGGKDAVPRDHNRDWDDRPEYPEVRAAQRLILRLAERQRFDVFVDLHNPGPNDRKPFFFAPKVSTLPQIQQRNFIRWNEIARRLIDDLQPEFRFTSYIKTEEERNRVSSNWVRNHTAPHVVALTLETAWNRPRGTAEGYQLVGRQLGQTIAEYLSNDPSRP